MDKGAIERLKKAVGIDHDESLVGRWNVEKQAPQLSPAAPAAKPLPPPAPAEPRPAVQAPAKPPALAQASKPKMKQPETSEEPPVFVKIDNHVEMVANMRDAKKTMFSMVDTISLLGEAEKLKAEAVGRMEQQLNHVDAKIQLVEQRLATPKDVKETRAEEPVRDEELEDLSSHIKELKTELRGL